MDEHEAPRYHPPADGTACNCPADVDPRIARYFDRRNRRRRSGQERYEMGNVTRRLLDALLELDPSGHSVLEGGCGPGALMVELLRGGASSGTGIDLSAEAIGYARERANEADVGERAAFVVGDAASTENAPHDWVVLDKVICCYPDMERLLGNTINAARQVYAFAVPVSYGWRGPVARLVLGIEAVLLRVMRRTCPAYVHDIGQIETRLRAAGFASIRRESLGMWHIGVFARPA
jgi:SAM-dependent methyltransferase